MLIRRAIVPRFLWWSEVGLDYNGISKRVDETRLYEAGRYFLGVRHSFIRFPKLMQTIHFDEEIADTLTTKTVRLTEREWGGG